MTQTMENDIPVFRSQNPRTCRRTSWGKSCNIDWANVVLTVKVNYPGLDNAEVMKRVCSKMK